MDFLLETGLNCQIIPVIKKNLGKNDIQNFIKYIQETENNDYINHLIKIIEDSPEIGQIILDIHYIYKINGIIECLILKYIENDNNEGLIDFFNFISKSFQINKNIYDFIYKQIGRLFKKPIEVLENNNDVNIKNKNIFKKCLNLLEIFYNKENDNLKIKNNFFYLYNNQITTNIPKDISNDIYIGMCLYINQYYENNKSIIVKIKFSNNKILSIKLSNNINIEIYSSKKQIGNSIKMKNNSWNIILIDKIKDKINININGNEFIENNNNLNIKKLNFYKYFHGIISPIIISDNKKDIINFFSENYIQNQIKEAQNITIEGKLHKNNIISKLNYNSNLILGLINGENKDIFNSILGFEIKKQINRTKSLFLKKINNKFNFEKHTIKRRNSMENNNTKLLNNNNIKYNYFPYLYSFKNKNLKDNIYLLGGVENILPLFEINYYLCQNDNNNLTKIIKILLSIISTENNIEDMINSNFLEIFSIYIEKYIINNNDKLSIIIKLIEKLLETQFNNDGIYFKFKKILLNEKIIDNLSQNGKNLFLKFLLNIQQFQKEVFQFLLTFIIEKEKIDEKFLENIFDFFYKYLESEVEKMVLDKNKDIKLLEKIGDICKILILEKINKRIILKLLNLLIKIFNIQPNKKIYENQLIINQIKIFDTFLTIKEGVYIKNKENKNIEKKENYKIINKNLNYPKKKLMILLI